MASEAENGRVPGTGEEEPLLGRAGDASQQDGKPLYYNFIIGRVTAGIETLELADRIFRDRSCSSGRRMDCMIPMSIGRARILM